LWVFFSSVGNKTRSNEQDYLFFFAYKQKRKNNIFRILKKKIRKKKQKQNMEVGFLALYLPLRVAVQIEIIFESSGQYLCGIIGQTRKILADEAELEILNNKRQRVDEVGTRVIVVHNNDGSHNEHGVLTGTNQVDNVVIPDEAPIIQDLNMPIQNMVTISADVAVLMVIYMGLDVQTMGRLSKTSRGFASALRNDRVWVAMLKRDFPDTFLHFFVERDELCGGMKDALNYYTNSFPENRNQRYPKRFYEFLKRISKPNYFFDIFSQEYDSPHGTKKYFTHITDSWMSGEFNYVLFGTVSKEMFSFHGNYPVLFKIPRNLDIVHALTTIDKASIAKFNCMPRIFTGFLKDARVPTTNFKIRKVYKHDYDQNGFLIVFDLIIGEVPMTILAYVDAKDRSRVLEVYTKSVRYMHFQTEPFSATLSRTKIVFNQAGTAQGYNGQSNFVVLDRTDESFKMVYENLNLRNYMHPMLPHGILLHRGHFDMKTRTEKRKYFMLDAYGMLSEYQISEPKRRDVDFEIIIGNDNQYARTQLKRHTQFTNPFMSDVNGAFFLLPTESRSIIIIRLNPAKVDLVSCSICSGHEK
jgi:hypothetical protein